MMQCLSSLITSYIPELSGKITVIDFHTWYFIAGKPVFGKSGELVCTKPFPCQPTKFWNDPKGIKYKKAYFEKFDG